MSIILIVLGIILLVCAFVINKPLVVEYRKWIVLLGILLVLWGIFGILVALLITIIVFLLIHFRIIKV